jgi:hypothetical protein
MNTPARTLAALLAVACNIALCVSSVVAQDIRGYTARLEAINPLTGLWLAEARLYLDQNLEVDRPYLVEFSFADTLWLSSRVELGNDNQLVMRTYSGWLQLSLAPGVVVASILFGQRVPGITNIPGSEGTWIGCTSTTMPTGLSPNPNLPILFGHQNTVVNNQGVYSWDPNIWDPDGDSLSIELVPCFEGHWLPLNTQINSQTGVITSVPEMPGKYAYCAEITKLRRLPNGGPVFSTGKAFYEVTFDVPTVVGLTETSAGQTILIAPNPASHRLLVSSQKGLIEHCIVRAADGRMVLEMAINAARFEIDISELAQGPYYLSLASHSSAQSVKFMVE